MKKYLLFAGNAYYPFGGMWDFCGDFDTVEEAKAVNYVSPVGEDPCAALTDDEFRVRIEPEWKQVVERETMKVVYAEGHSCYGDPEIFKL